MLRKLINFFREYRQFGLASLSVIAALALDLYGWDTAAHWVLALSAIANVIPLVWNMVQDLRAGTYGVDILAATAIVTSVIMNEYWAAIIIVLMLTGGELLEDYAQKRARSELSALMDRAPKKAHVLRGRRVLDVKVSEIHVKDKVLIKPGEIVPVDAVIIEGAANFDESSLTGESVPVTKDVGDQLLSGSVNLDGAITARVLRTAQDSQYEQIIQLVKAAASSKSPFVRLADRYSIPFTLAAFAIAITAWTISGESIRFLEVLVVATPCPLIFGAPVALISGMSRSAKHGIIIKTGAALERLAALKTIGFDKTGTLTKGKPEIGEIKIFYSFDEDTVLSVAAGLEQNSTHVLAKAIVDNAKTRGLKAAKAKHVKEFSGMGLSATASGKQVLVGRLSFLQEQGTELPKGFKAEGTKQTATYVAIDGKLAGIINFTDELRPESKSTIENLYNLGIKNTLMVTGDNPTTANAIAKQLGINDVRANALPVDKLNAVEGIKLRPVGFVGDGVNDAPVLAAADVGIALGARGSTAASESADVVIMLDDIGRVATAVSIAKRTFYIAKQSIWIGIAISVGLMFIFSTGRFKPVHGALIQEVVDVIVIFNALRAHGSWRKNQLPVTQLIATT